jgi:F420-0:gamma-glutamyl ligase
LYNREEQGEEDYMTRYIGTVARGLRTPIYSEGDNLIETLPELLVEAATNSGFTINDKDVLAITESIVARAQGNYASIYDIEVDLTNKLNGNKTLGLTFPILSRNRFSTLLRGIARAVDEVIIQLSYPADEVGNHLFPSEMLFEANVNPWQDVLDEKQFFELFGKSKHPFTGMDYIELYKEIVELEGATCKIIFGNDVTQILDYTDVVLTCDVHTRHQSKRMLNEKGAKIVLGLDDLLNQQTFLHGYNEKFGLLGSNKASEERIKLFPRDCQPLVDNLAKRIKELTHKNVEVMIYGDGAFKDPVGRIWELADPVVSPAYTQGLEGKPSELKLKYLADNDFKDLSQEEQQEAINKRIRENKASTHDEKYEDAVGTTPRQLTDLLGSLADLTSGSGDKGTPVVYIQGYFDNYSD